MRLRHIKNSESLIYDSPYVLNDKNFSYDKTKDIYIELGMGKGSFIIENALKYNNINFIGIEKYSTIIIKSIENLNLNIKTHDYDFNNLKFLCIDIDNIMNFFTEDSISKIYINFPDPWPKKRHEKRRLTHLLFLNKYYDLLKKGSFIEFKTDNKDLFDFSLDQIKNSKFKLVYYTYDLHNDSEKLAGNIMTEYEKKFTKKNMPICKLVLKKLD